MYTQEILLQSTYVCMNSFLTGNVCTVNLSYQLVMFRVSWKWPMAKQSLFWALFCYTIRNTYIPLSKINNVIYVCMYMHVVIGILLTVRRSIYSTCQAADDATANYWQEQVCVIDYVIPLCSFSPTPNLQWAIPTHCLGGIEEEH